MPMNIQTKLASHIPDAALLYCVELWKKYHFEFKITRKRITKAGDYRYNPSNKSHCISVNNNLNHYAFLITYIHEVAHRVVMNEFGRSVKPHGNEWKNCFRQLMLPLLNPNVFPDDVLRSLSGYMRSPKASSYSDIALTQCLRNYDNAQNGKSKTLNSLLPGQTFHFHKRQFEKEATKRTRVICKELKTGRKYLIPALAIVDLLEG